MLSFSSIVRSIRSKALACFSSASFAKLIRVVDIEGLTPSSIETSEIFEADLYNLNFYKTFNYKFLNFCVENCISLIIGLKNTLAYWVHLEMQESLTC